MEIEVNLPVFYCNNNTKILLFRRARVISILSEWEATLTRAMDIFESILLIAY